MYKLHIRILAKELALPRSIVALFNYILLLLMLTLTKGKNKKKQNAKILCQVSLEKESQHVFLKANVSFAQLCTGKCAIE